MICAKLLLPRGTSLISHDQRSSLGSHFRVFNVNDVADKDGNRKYGKIASHCTRSFAADDVPAITMKLPGSDVVGIDASVSLSHCAVKAITNALVVCRSSSQISCIADTVETLGTVATHPVALPTILCSLHQNKVIDGIDLSWRDMFQIEHKSGQSGIVVGHRGERIRPSGKCDDPDLSRKAIGVTQLAISWETYAAGGQMLIDAVKLFLKSYVTDNDLKNEVLADQSQVLLEHLDLIALRADSLQHRAKHLRSRAEVQVSAV